jgi:hypothetical protein
MAVRHPKNMEDFLRKKALKNDETKFSAQFLALGYEKTPVIS